MLTLFRCYKYAVFSLQDIKAFDSSLARFKTLEELFPPGTIVFMVGNPYYGTMGDVCTGFCPLQTSCSC